ncbi:hypothetical protein HYC85_007683 [Camellia sinensis]|uniref:Uncharacterized protein n=1 Tax=Camellia sinensis TaxID=4442 RepID=A0A7J7HQY9_CAMSI|nr:hypothetical protein HYC85_007683 [Camellia sinensis]
MGSALDTFCGQPYGAKQYHMLGIHKQRAMLVLLLANAGHILVFLGQDPEISAEAGSYARFMIPSIFAYALLQCHVQFLQTQNNVFPMMLSSRFTTLLHVLICWILVFKSGLGNKGAVLANAISYWINVILLAIYVRGSPSCKNTWTGFSKDALHDIPKFLRLAIPSALMPQFAFHGLHDTPRIQRCHKGLWVGIIVALFAQALFLSIITLCTHWEKEANKASDRVYGPMIPVEASPMK